MIDPQQPDYANTPASERRPAFAYALADARPDPVLTIVTPFFNTGALFHETARSVMRQSLQQWEWLIVNDASNDPEALRVLAQYRHADARIRVIDIAVNGGPSRARNVGYAQARTPFVLQLDSDNLLEPTAAEKWWWYLETHPRAAFVNSYGVGFDAETYLWRFGYHTPERFLESNPVDGTSLVRVAAHREVGGYDESIRNGLEDWDFWMRCAATGRWGATIPEFLNWYRRRANHHDRWSQWDGGPRQKAFVRELHAKYPNVRPGRFPDVAPPSPVQNAPVSAVTPAANRLLKAPRRLLLVVPWMAMGGSDKFNLDLVEQLTARGWSITIAATRSDSTWMPHFERVTPDVFALPAFLPLPDFPRFLLYLLRSRQPDIVMVSHAELGYHLLPFLRAHAPEVAFVDYCHVVEDAWLNGGYPRLSVQYRSFLDASIASSSHLRDWMRAEGADEKRLSVCYTGGTVRNEAELGAARAQGRQALGVDGDSMVLVYPARLCAQKQPRVFAETMRTLAQMGIAFTCVVAGDGPERAWLGTYVKQHRLTTHVRLLEAVSPSKMRMVMAAADVCFLPSAYEGIALTVYEAMAAGTVFVGADVGGQREVLTDECGVLLPRLGDEQREAAAYAETLARLMRDRGELRRRGATARRRITEAFTTSHMIEAIEGAFRQAQQLHRDMPQVGVEPDIGNLMATRAIEYERMAGVAEMLWSQRPAAMSATGGGWRLWIFRQCTLLEPAYAWGLRRGWQWLPAARERIRSALAS